MKSPITITQDDLLEMNIRLIRDLVVEANTTPYKEKKIKSLFLANKLIEKSLINEGIINLDNIKIKRKKK